MRDRFTRGFTAGIIGGIVANLVNYILGVTGVTDLTYLAWTSVVIYDHVPPFTLPETTFAVVGQLIFTGGLGVVFAYLFPVITSSNLVFKGTLLGMFLWFLIDGITTLFKIEGTYPTSLSTAMSDYFSAALYGLTLVQALAKLEYLAEAEPSMMPQPAMKPMRDAETEEDSSNSE
jgi:hypothetical protein